VPISYTGLWVSPIKLHGLWLIGFALPCQKNHYTRSIKTKTPLAVLVERDGNSRATKVVSTDTRTLKANIRKNVAKTARIMTNEWQAYNGLENEFACHEIVDYGHGEYVKGDAYTNTA
jgi:hypothetical protein